MVLDTVLKKITLQIMYVFKFKLTDKEIKEISLKNMFQQHVAN